MKALRVGVVGCGVAANDLHLPALARIAETEPVALADPSREALNATAARFGIDRVSADYRELLDDRSIDVVCIAAPTELHTEIALAAIDAGKHLLVEKPLAISVDDCDLLIERAAAAGVRTMVGFNLRWHRHVLRARKLIRRGDLGAIRLLASTYASAAMLRPPEWRADPERGGGVLALQAVHHFDLWRFLLGQEIDQVSCIPAADGSPGMATMSIAGSTEGGIGISSSFCGLTGQENTFAVYGSQEWLRASLYSFDRFEKVHRGATIGDIAHHLRRPARFFAEFMRALPNARRGGDFAASYQAEWRHLADALRRDTPIESGFEDGREVARILAAVLESARSGSAVRIAEAAPRLPPSGVGTAKGDDRRVEAKPGR